MNKLTRILTMGGFGLLAALTTGAGAAHAATPVSTPAGKSAEHVVWRSGSDVVGFYRSLPSCQLAGVYGERRGDWDDFNCSITRVGVRNGAWALQAASDDDWNRFGFGVPFRAIGGFPGHFRPVWPGQFGAGRPGHGFGGGNHGGGNHGGGNHGGGNNGGGNNGGGNNGGGNNGGGNHHHHGNN